MTNFENTPLPDELQEIGAHLRENRHEPSQLELDELKRRALTRASRVSRRRSGLALKARLASSLLVLGLCMSAASAGVIAGSSSSVEEKSAAVSQYEIAVLGETAAPGNARLSGPSGCVGRPFTARVTGRNIRSVVFRVDGRRIKTVTRPDSRGRFTVRIDPRRYSTGAHRLTGRVTFQAITRKRPQTFRLTFLRCLKKAAPPRFTG